MKIGKKNNKKNKVNKLVRNEELEEDIMPGARVVAPAPVVAKQIPQYRIAF